MNKIDQLRTWKYHESSGELVNSKNGVIVTVTVSPRGDDALYRCSVLVNSNIKTTKHDTFNAAFYHANNEIDRMNSIDVTWGDSLVFELGAMRAEIVELKDGSPFSPKYSYTLHCNGRFAGGGGGETIEDARRGVEDLVNGRA